MQVIIYEGANIELVENDGVFYLALKAMCAILGIDYNRNFKNIKVHQTFSKHTLLLTHVGADNKRRKMICISETYVYGWIYSIRSKSLNLLKFQEGLYNALKDHFKPKSQILTVKSKKP